MLRNHKDFIFRRACLSLLLPFFLAIKRNDQVVKSMELVVKLE